MFRTWLRMSLLAAALVVCGTARAAEPNTLTDDERAAGWKLLFDGKTTNGWRRFKGEGVGDKWQVIDGALVFKPKGGKTGGDIITLDQFDNFELAIEWRVNPGSNSGIIYRVSEEEAAPFFTGPEYQILDNDRHPDGKNKLTSAASCYALYAPSRVVTKPVGEWNQGRIVAVGNHIEHWLNGVKVVSYDIDSDDWNRLVQASKFKEWKKFGRMKKGHIDLQDHGDEVAYRNIKIRTIKE